MSDRAVLPEWGIQLRNIVDRMVPVINEDHATLHAQEARIRKLEAEVAQLRTMVQAQATTLGQVQGHQMVHCQPREV